MTVEAEVLQAFYAAAAANEAGFETGDISAANAAISDDVEAVFYFPWSDKVERYSGPAYKEGNLEAAAYYKGKGVKHLCANVQVLPQGEDRAAVSYQIVHVENGKTIRALALEAWKKESDGVWRMVRCYMEKGARP